MKSHRVVRIVTKDLPRYFATVTRCRLETATIGPAGAVLSSSVEPQVQAVFPEGALMKSIKVGLQVTTTATTTTTTTTIVIILFCRTKSQVYECAVDQKLADAAAYAPGRLFV